jgi:hypothetical protein
MTEESARLGNRLTAKGVKLPPELSLLQHPPSLCRYGASGNYGKYLSTRIDSVTKPIGANLLIHSAKPLKNNTALSIAIVSRFFRTGAPTGCCPSGGRAGGRFEWGVPQGLRGLFRVGA